MIKASRLTAFILVLSLLCGMITTAGANVCTLGVYLSGKRTAGDGTETTVRLDGKFRVLVNGEEAGIIEAGKTTLTITETGTVRIMPLPESIEPGWDLSAAYCSVEPQAGGTLTIPVTLYPLKADATQPEAEAAPAAETPEEPAEEQGADPETPDETVPGEADETEGTEEAEPEEAEEDQPLSETGPVVTPTLPPADLSALEPTPEPAWTELPAGSGSVTACAYGDQNSTGTRTEGESGVAGVTVCLFTEAGEAVAAAETGADGLAQFTGLPAGKYCLKAILPDGWAFGKKGSEAGEWKAVFDTSIEGEAMSDPFEVTEGQAATPGIALSRCLHVSGLCWFDVSNDGLYTDDEPLLPGVRIALDGDKNGLHYETISDADGTWRIERVKPASHTLTAYVPEGMMFARVPTRNGRKTVIAKTSMTSASTKVDLNDKESKEKLYIGFIWASNVHGRCFLDANYNGLYDEGEDPMPGVKVTAIKQMPGEEVAVTFSGEDGTYVLPVRAGTYRMRAVLPEDGSDFTKTVEDLAGNHFTARPGRRENFWNNFVLQFAERREMNVGVIYPGSITGYVYQDNDFSATRGDKEKIVSGFLVKLMDADGNLAAMDKTSVKGKYELTGLAPGTYTMEVTALKDYAFTKIGEGNVILNRTNGEGYSEPITVELGEHKTGLDIGMIRPGTVEGRLFADRNDNGIQDEGENGLPGVTVRLVGEEGEAFSAEIGEDGKYMFDAVMPGTYYLEFELPENAVFARITNGGNTIDGEHVGRSESFTMASGDLYNGPVCGALTLGRIEGTAFMDHDGSGTREDGDEPAEGMIVTLTPSRSELEEITAETDETGAYSLEGLRPDTYTLTVTCPERHVLSRTKQVSLPLAPGKQTQSAQLSVAMGAEWTGQMLGTVIPASLSGQLWLDENNNGLFDEGEQTPAGYAITVTDEKSGTLFDTLRTDEEGRFATEGMIPGPFTLSFPLDENTIAPKPGNSDFEEEDGKLVLKGIELNEDESRSGILLGIVRYTSIDGSVWIDRGDTVEALAGAKITLKDGDGAEVAAVTTGGDGKYLFSKLMPGEYRIEAEMPEGCVIIEPGDSRLDNGLVSVMTETANRSGASDLIELKMAEDRRKMDIGCVLPGRLGDFCWLDLDGDGLQGLDEPGIPDVKIELMRDGEVIMETVTDQYGFYRFSDIYPAEYTLRVTAPAEVTPTQRRTDIRLIASVLEETDEEICLSVEIQVESDKANYNADLGFICRVDGQLPPGIGQGRTQDWTKIRNTEN